MREVCTNTTVEAVILEICLQCMKVLLTVAYIPPESHSSIYSNFVEAIEETVLPDICWTYDPLMDQAMDCIPPEGRLSTAFVYTAASSFELQQLYPVHLSKQYNLDLVFASRGIVKNLDIDDNILLLDDHHFAANFEVESPPVSVAADPTPGRDFINADYVDLVNAFGALTGLMTGQ